MHGIDLHADKSSVITVHGGLGITAGRVFGGVVVGHNPSLASRRLCHTLGILPPDLVSMVNTLEKRGLITKRSHPRDGRAMGLHPTEPGEVLMREAEKQRSTWRIKPRNGSPPTSEKH